jgi:hypothetical protein
MYEEKIILAKSSGDGGREMSEGKEYSCETGHHGCCETAHDYHYKWHGGCEGDHSCPTQMLMCWYHEAKKAVMVDILKAKIHKAWGAKMEETADLIVEAMDAKKKGRSKLKNKLYEIWEKD